uniref:Uncharacterized protein n=1 Tax=Arundo donax TaxID=35708 RepID=A0A0A9C2H0_ARUDO
MLMTYACAYYSTRCHHTRKQNFDNAEQTDYLCRLSNEKTECSDQW